MRLGPASFGERFVDVAIGLISGRRSWIGAELLPPDRSNKASLAAKLPVSEVECHLLAEIAERTASDAPITRASEVSYDLWLSGDDLEEFLDWIAKTYEVDFSLLKARDFPLNEPPPTLHDWRGRAKFKSMTVDDLLSAIETKCWKN
jgi:hypothetical protein